MKKVLLFVVIVLVVGGGIWAVVAKNKNKSKTEDTAKVEQTTPADTGGTVSGVNTTQDNTGVTPILFIGEGCPHCKKVEDYIAANKIDEKIKFDKKEVWYNKDNATIMKEKATICKIPEDQMGVPLLFDGSKCYVGEIEIEDFFNSKLNAQ